MKQFLGVIFSIAIVFNILGCKKEVIYPKEDFMIEFGTECGWCAGSEYIVVSPSLIKYERVIPCDENKGTYKKNKALDAAAWDSIWSTVDFNLLKTLDYDECNLCADGCDEIIRVKKFEEIHEIRFAPEKEIEGIETLRLKLTDILIEFREQD